MERIKTVVKCQRTIELINKALKAGYIDPETNKLQTSSIGTPQGSVLSPLLCNIVLHELDKFMESLRVSYNNGEKRRPNPAYVKLNSRRRYIKDPFQRAKALVEMRKLLASDPMDPNFRRLKYVRYADDFVILIIGPYSDAVKIREKVRNILTSRCGLELNLDKTVISNIQKEGFKFLGADCNRADMTKNHVVKLKRNVSIRATTRLRVNIDLEKVYRKLVSNKLAK
jgi:retron-type reverse transcriptase